MRIRSSKNSSPPNYCINGIPISTSTTTRDLGVLIDSQLSYNDHITQITSKASQRVGALFRGFLCRDLQFLRRVYIMYIRPILEYCSVIWNPTLKKHIDQIEDVQRRFTKRIPSISNLSYLERLARFNLEPLELRRLHFDLFYYYRILNNLAPHDPLDFFSFHYPPTSFRNSTPIMVKPVGGNRTSLSSFRFRAANCWNFLPPQIKECNSYPKFKTLVKRENLSSFLYGSPFTNIADFKIFA